MATPRKTYPAKCTQCHILKEKEDYAKSANGKRHSACKECKNAARRALNAAKQRGATHMTALEQEETYDFDLHNKVLKQWKPTDRSDIQRLPSRF